MSDYYSSASQRLCDLSDDILFARLERLQLDYKHADSKLAQVRADLMACERERAERTRRRFTEPETKEAKGPITDQMSNLVNDLNGGATEIGPVAKRRMG
jgi:hypothetical protein